MLLSIYILLQVLAVIGLIFVFMNKSPMVSALAMIPSGMLMAGAWVIDLGNKYIWNVDLKAYDIIPNIINTPYLAYVNILLFGIAMLYFFYDLFSVIMEQKSGYTDSPNRQHTNNQGGLP